MRTWNSFVFTIAVFFNIISYGQSVILLNPLDDITGVSGYPVFSWQYTGTPPVGLSYTFKIAEFNPSIGEISSLNTPLHSEVIADNSSSIFFDYPVLLQPLDTCKHYVWQVIASYTTYTSEEPIVPLQTYNYVSTVNHFYTHCENEFITTEEITSNKLYINPQKTASSYIYMIHTDSLYLRYREEYSNENIQYRIYSNPESVAVNWTNLPVLYGLNYVGIDITSTTISASPKIYTFEIKTAKGEIYKAKFEKLEP